MKAEFAIKLSDLKVKAKIEGRWQTVEFSTAAEASTYVRETNTFTIGG